MADPKPVNPRQIAFEDIQQAVEHYRDTAGADTAVAFVDALQATFNLLGRHPGIGSTRFEIELELPGPRMHPLTGFPYLVFYLERQDHIDVWRVLHGHRDIPAWMHPHAPT